MGHPLGPKKLMLFCVISRKKWLAEWPVEFLPNVYKRYVDDIFVTFNSYSQLLKFVDYTNHILTSSSLSKLKNNVSFLDVKICRENKFITSVFRKPTLSSVFTNLGSFIPISYKHGVVNTLIFRYFKTSFSYENLHNKIVYLKEIFKRNRYPNNLVDRCIKKFFDKLYITKKFIKRLRKSNY